MKSATKDERLPQIYEAALRVFARYGYRRARVEDIADELGMTKGNLYLYVKGKRDLYERAVAYGLVRWQNRAKETIAAHQDPADQLVAYAINGLTYLRQDENLRTILINDPGIFPLSPQDDPYKEINDVSMGLLKDILRRGVAQKRFVPFDVELVAPLFYSVYVMFIIKTYVKADGQSTSAMFTEGIQLMLGGMLAPADTVPAAPEE